MRSPNFRAPRLAAMLLLAVVPSLQAQIDTAHGARTPHGQSSGYTPHRVWDVAAGAFIDFETLASRAAAADVVFFGERHGHAAGHRLQHALLEAVGRRADATLSLEMFERDVAGLVAGYAAGSVDPAAFAAESRPWPRFFSDYHATFEEARGRGWPIVAANVPRELAALVAQEGLAALDSLPPERRAHAAADIRCPDDDYRRRFIEEMNRHPSGSPASPEEQQAREQRYYESQCVKDETMAEAIVGALREGRPRPVIHLTGAFHSDHGDGIPVRVRRRQGDVVIMTLTVVPVPDLDAAHSYHGVHASRADYLLFTLSEAPPASPHQP